MAWYIPTDEREKQICNLGYSTQQIIIQMEWERKTFLWKQ